MSRKALGRGLSALFTETGSIDQDLVEIGIEQIDPSEVQPRQVFRQEKLAELAASLKANGLIQPVVVRRRGERFQLIAGERRWRAAQLAGLHKIPAVVKNVPDGSVLELSLIENLQRENLNPIEEAGAYKNLLDKLGYTQEQLAQRVGRDRSSIANSLRLLKLPTAIQALVGEEKLSMGHARALIGLGSAADQEAMASRILSRGLSVRETERLVKQPRGASLREELRTPQRRDSDPNVNAAELKLKRKLGAPVKISLTKRGGSILIKFSTMDDLTRIFEILIERGKS
jgi:ParB family chromosome partitioning protein